MEVLLASVIFAARVASCTAIVARSIDTTVRGILRTVRVFGAGTTDTRVSVTDRLAWRLTTIFRTTVGVGFAVNTCSVSLTVGELSVGFTSSVSVASVWVLTDSRLADGVGSHRSGPIVGDTVSVVGAGTASAILVAVLACRTGVVGCAGGLTYSVGATDGLSRGFTTITTPSVTSLAISIVSAGQTDTIGHAVGTLGSSTLGISFTTTNASS